MSNDKDIFLNWVTNELNPWRLHEGLKIIDDDEAMQCFDILQKFHDKMSKIKPQNPLKPCADCEFGTRTKKVDVCTECICCSGMREIPSNWKPI